MKFLFFFIVIIIGNVLVVVKIIFLFYICFFIGIENWIWLRLLGDIVFDNFRLDELLVLLLIENVLLELWNFCWFNYKKRINSVCKIVIE